ncbi:MAG: TraR/DksA C4-type zinc finger protein [Deltaproteobacteria bacterium]|nr:TraR/DksA C4-type zinc finger protein [Deltaproteobacteria bacterium]
MANSKKKKLKVKPKKAVAKVKKAKAKPAKQKIRVKKHNKKPLVKPAPKPVPLPSPRPKESFKKEITKKLLKAKEDLLAEVAEKIKNESNSLKFEIGDIYDIASNERERELTLMLGDRDREKLAEIEEALERIENGSYGVCDECGELITEGRLMAMPFTKVCIDCKSKDEREKGARKRYEEEAGLAMLEKAEVEEEEF